MALQILFGDDEHTAADGPYSRVLKVRKWIYLSSAGLIIVANDFYSADALNQLFPVILVPVWFVGQALTVGLIYLLFQYTLLSGQLAVTYDLVIDERLRFRRVEELAAARANLQAAIEEFEADLNLKRQSIDEAMRRQVAELSTLISRRDGFETELARLEPQAAPSTNRDRLLRDRDELGQEIGRASQIVEDLREHWDELRRASAERLSNEQVKEASDAYEELRKQNPAGRGGYRLFELGIDLARVLTPPIVAGFSLFTFSRA